MASLKRHAASSMSSRRRSAPIAVAAALAPPLENLTPGIPRSPRPNQHRGGRIGRPRGRGRGSGVLTGFSERREGRRRGGGGGGEARGLRVFAGASEREGNGAGDWRRFIHTGDTWRRKRGFFLSGYHPLTRGRELVELQSGPKRVADKISRKAGAGRIRPLGRLCLGLQNVHG